MIDDPTEESEETLFITAVEEELDKVLSDEVGAQDINRPRGKGNTTCLPYDAQAVLVTLSGLKRGRHRIRRCIPC